MRATRPSRPAERGQILVLFVLSLAAIFAMASVLFDGAHALVQRRQQQNASDTAALAAANLIQALKGCSATYVSGTAPGSPRAAITTAAVNAVQTALPGTPASAITVTCPDSWNNYAVQVVVAGHSPSYFGSALGVRGFDVTTTSQAVNGPVAPAPYSVIVLDNQSAAGSSACPSTLISGGPTITLEGSMIIDSACPAGSGGGLGTNGNSATLTMNNGAVIKIQGGYSAAALTISPTPQTGQPYVSDPLSKLPVMPTLTTQSASRLVINGTTQVLSPGRYIGGIQLKSSAKVFMRPGIYVMDGGGFDMGSQSAAYSVPNGVSTTTDATWATDCPEATCGVLLYNVNWANTSDQITIGAGATMKLRPYKSAVDTTGPAQPAYDNLLIWQRGTPAPPSSTQPVIALGGGGSVDLSGTVYAPGAKVYMTGGSGGSGGGTDVTLQFICWDLQIQGNSSFHFYYNNTKFASPPDYGLVK